MTICSLVPKSAHRACRALCASGALLITAGCDQRHAYPLAPAPVQTAHAEPSPTSPSSSPIVDVSAVSHVRVKQGAIVYVTPISGLWQPPTIDLKGTAGFRLEGFAAQDQNATGTFFSPHCESVVGCPPGETIPFSAQWSGGSVGADARLRGTTYENIGSLESEAGFVMRTTGALTFPPAPSSPTATTVVVASAPFELAGTLFLPGEEITLTGEGTATFTLEWSPVDLTWYVVRAELQMA